MAILVGILIPTLSGARAEATAISRLATMRMLHQGLGAYAEDSAGAFLFLATPGAPERWLTAWGRIYPSGDYFGGQSRYWPTLLWPSYIADTGEDRYSSRARPAPGPYPPTDSAGHAMQLVQTLFRLTSTAFAHSAYWDGDAPPTSLELLRGTRHADIKHPGSKGILLDVGTWEFDGDQANPTGMLSIAAGDGSASRHRLALVDPAWVVERPFGATPWRVIATRGGLAGRDY